MTLILPSALGSVEMLVETAEAFAVRAGFTEDDLSGIALVVREAGVNAVLHGNQQDLRKEVTADFILTEESLTIQISDQGDGFKPESVVDPLQEENLMRTSGRGVFLMRAIMDGVHFTQLSPGTRVILTMCRTNKERE